MKKTFCLATGLLALNLATVLAQPAPNPIPNPPQPMLPARALPMPSVPPAPPGPTFEQRLQAITRAAGSQPDSSQLTKFNLDFPGGTPTDLAKAIEKAMDKPLNVIINKEDANTELPPLKMNQVVLPQLFAALEATSRKSVAVSAGYGERFGGGSYSIANTSYGFKTADSPVTDTTIWYFYVEKPSMPPIVSTQKITQFYSLAPYLDRGFTVDDITTAIQTGWKMSGETAPPELNYHKETKLLIAYGEPEKLKTINNVLVTLPSSNATRDELNNLWGNVHDLQKNLDLQKKLADFNKKAAAPEEKSGK